MGRILTLVFRGLARNLGETELLPRSSACGSLHPSRAAFWRTWLLRKRMQRTPSKMHNQAKSFTRHARARWPSWARFHSSVITERSTQRSEERRVGKASRPLRVSRSEESKE